MEKELVDQKQLIIEEDEIDLVDLLKTIYKNRKLILAIALVVTLLGLVFALVQKKMYTSEITFVEQKSSSNNSMLASLASSIPFGLGSSLGSGNSGGTSLVVVLESRMFREKVASSLQLRKYIIETTEMKEEAQADFDMVQVTNWLKDIATVAQDTKTSVYKVVVELEDKEMATKIANEYFTILDDYLKNTKLDKSKINREYLEKQVESVEKDLTDKQNIVKTYEKKYNSASIEADSKIAIESSAIIKGEIMKTESALNVARGIFGEESVDVKKLNDTLSEYKKQLNNLEKGTGTVKFVPVKDIANIKYDLEKLKTEISATAEVYKMLRVQLEQSKLDEISNRSVIELLDKAVEPRNPSSTSRMIILVISGVLGVFVGVSTAFVKEFAKGINWQEFKN